MSDWSVQKALYARLCADATLTGLLAEGADSIRDHVREGTPFPYLVFSDMASKPFDTQDSTGREISLTINVFSRTPGFKEVRDILSALHALLHNADFEIEGHNLILCQETDCETMAERDGTTRRGVMTCKIIAEVN